LGVTTRDDRRRIVELAEEKSLELDHDVCQKARSDLTNPRSRLSVEMAWLPGVSPRKASQLVENLLHNPMAIREESGLPTLAHLNLLAAAFELWMVSTMRTIWRVHHGDRLPCRRSEPRGCPARHQ
jgi:hypothetical protein